MEHTLYLVQKLCKIQFISFLPKAFLSISIMMLAAFSTNVLEKPAIKLVKIGSGVKSCDKI